MKNLFTLILMLLSFTIFSQDLQLDSILIEDENAFPEYSFSFEYEDGKLSKYIEDNDVEVTISYTDFGEFNQWKVDVDDELNIWKFVYDDQERLDSIYIEFDYDDNALFEYFYTGDQLSSFIFSTNDYGTYFPIQKKVYEYSDNDVTTSTYSLYGSYEELFQIKFEDFDDTDRLTKVIYNYDSINIDNIDSLVYDMEGSLVGIYNTEYDNGVPSEAELTRQYLSDPAHAFKNITNPSKIFAIILQLDEDIQYSSIYYPLLYANKVDEQQNQVFNGLENSYWYYSMFVSNKNERVSTTPISVYPNPSTDKIRIESDKKMSAYELYNMNGQLVQSGNLLGNTLNVETIPDGHYTLTCSTKDEKYFFAQFVKQ